MFFDDDNCKKQYRDIYYDKDATNDKLDNILKRFKVQVMNIKV